MRSKLLVFSFLALGVVLMQWFISYNSSPNISPLTHSWEKAIPHQKIPEGLGSLSAKHCGACHQDHYNEWKLSTHAHAWTDLQFQAELKKETSPYLCINCHIPLQNQQEYVVSGLIDGDIYQPVKKKNPHFDPGLMLEGITCASCHVRNGYVIGPNGSTKAPHETKRDTNHLSEKLCISCHNAVAVVTPTLACSFETGDEWKAGPYFGKMNCISCHMETTHREIVPGYGKRNSRFHYFPGSGIPKFDSSEAIGLNGLEFYPTSINKKYTATDTFIYTLKVKNEHAGHRLPTGDPERFFMISLELKNEEGKILNAVNERIGEEWIWHPEAKKLNDNNLAPLEERSYLMEYLIKEKGKLSLSVRVTKHRMSKEAALYNKLGSEYPLSIMIFEESHVFVVE